jgi:hypothetical protein
MIKRVLVGVGLFTLGYLLGRSLGRAERPPAGRLTWEGAGDQGAAPGQPVRDAEFSDDVVRRPSGGVGAR